jgi:hypothetical protein
MGRKLHLPRSRETPNPRPRAAELEPRQCAGASFTILGRCHGSKPNLKFRGELAGHYLPPSRPFISSGRARSIDRFDIRSAARRGRGGYGPRGSHLSLVREQS